MVLSRTKSGAGPSKGTAGRLIAPRMVISVRRQAIVTGPAISRYYRAYFHDILDEACQAWSCDIGVAVPPTISDIAR